MSLTLVKALQEILAGNFSQEVLLSIVMATAYIFVAVIVERLLWRYAKVAIEKKFKEEEVARPFKRLTSYTLFFILIVIILYLTGFSEVVVVIGGLGLFFSIVLGFSLRVLLENFIAGLMIFISDEVKVGERIKVAGSEGKVIERGLRYITLKDDKGNKVKIPNSLLVTTVVVKYEK